MKVSLIGLVGMGPPMATNLLKAGYGVRIYRTAEKARPLLEQGAIAARPRRPHRGAS
jgi:3-hydroxyisobutyrate dehydrogenase